MLKVSRRHMAKRFLSNRVKVQLQLEATSFPSFLPPVWTSVAGGLLVGILALTGEIKACSVFSSLLTSVSICQHLARHLDYRLLVVLDRQLKKKTMSQSTVSQKANCMFCFQHSNIKKIQNKPLTYFLFLTLVSPV